MNPDTLNALDINKSKTFQVPKLDPLASDNALLGAVQGQSALTQAYNTAQSEALKSSQKETGLTSDISSLLGQLSGVTPETQTLQEQQGLPQMNKELKDLQNLQATQTAQYLKGLTTIEGKPISMEGKSIGETALQRQHGIDSLITSAQIQSKLGNIQTAQDLVDKAISAKYGPIKQAIQAKQFLLEQANTKASRDAQTANSLLLKKIEKEQADATAMEKMLVDASQVAPADVLANAKAIKAKGGSLTDVAMALGKYGGDYYKTELLKQQIETEKAQRSNYLASAAKTRTETSLLGQPLGIDGVIATLPKSSQERYYKLQNDFDQATKNYRGAIDSASSITALSKDATPQQQTAIIFQYMKTLDPSSTVREGEFALVGKTAGLGDRAVNALKKLDNGSRLNESQINDIVGATKILAENAKKNLELTSNEYDRRAVKFGLPKGLFYEKQVDTPVDNKFSQALPTGGMSKIPGTSIINKVNPDGSFNFILPTNQPTR